MKISFFRKSFSQITGAFKLIFRRQINHLGLTTLALIGIILAVALVTDAYFFSEAVDRTILLQELNDFSQMTGRPPFATNVYVFPSSRRPLSLEETENLAEQIANTLSGQVGLPLQHVGMQVSSGSMILQPDPDSELYGSETDFLGTIRVMYISGIAPEMEIAAGDPLDDDGVSGEIMDVWLHDRLVQEMGIQLGDVMNIRFTLRVEPVVVRIAGFWHARDPNADFWFNPPDTLLKEVFLVRRQDYIQRIQPFLSSGTREASWYVILDSNKLNPKNGQAYLEGFDRAKDLINRFLPEVRFNAPPLDPLSSFVQRSQSLTVLLLSYNLPAYGILLYFLTLISGIIAHWQEKETSILVSRGMTISGVLNVTLNEQITMFVIGYPLGIGLGMGIARLMGYASSFLTFTRRPPLPVSIEGLSIPLTILALSVSLLFRLWPTARAARQSVVGEEREWARPSGGPVWYRYYLDFLLVLPTYYFYDQMIKRGSLANIIVSSPDDLYRDPFLILVPALFVLTAALVIMRLFSVVMRLLDALANLTPWLAVHLALRQLGRQSQDYVQPLLLVIISLALGVYTLSMAASLDQWMMDRMYYQVGADVSFTPIPQVEGQTYSDGNWIPTPAEFDALPGVMKATRVGRYYALISNGAGRDIRGRLMAIDRLDFPAVAWFRSDFASESLGGLMNQLALAPDGVLISQDALTLIGLQVGDPLAVTVDVDNTYRFRTNFTIVGTYEYFPTVNEKNNPSELTFIGNFENLSTLLGFVLPHTIWLKLEPGITSEEITPLLPGGLGLLPSNLLDARLLVEKERGKLERIGIFGTLTIGFLATATMAILGLLVYSYASLRDRVYRFAVLQSIGLLRRQIITQVVLEYTFLSVFGSLTGAAIGAYASRLFIPFFRFTGERGTPLPPLLPLIVQDQTVQLALVFTVVIVLAEVMTIAYALRTRLARIH